MLANDRIKEAKTNVRQYREDGMLEKKPFRQIVFDTFMRNHRESLELAQHVYDKKMSNLWTIVISYYSMFYIANAALYLMGYKVGDNIAHKVTADALIDLVRDKLKDSMIEGYEEAKDNALSIAGARADTVIESFDYERAKRSIMQYETTEIIKASMAKTSVDRAKEFGLEMQKLMDAGKLAK